MYATQICQVTWSQNNNISVFFRLFGDESDVRFWTVALHYMRTEKAEPSSQARLSNQLTFHLCVLNVSLCQHMIRLKPLKEIFVFIYGERLSS